MSDDPVEALARYLDETCDGDVDDALRPLCDAIRAQREAAGAALLKAGAAYADVGDICVALTAERDALRARVAELEAEQARVAGMPSYPTRERPRARPFLLARELPADLLRRPVEEHKPQRIVVGRHPLPPRPPEWRTTRLDDPLAG